MPCHDCPRPTISNLFVYVFASLIAASLLSEPVLRNKARSRPAGKFEVSRFANSITGGVIMQEDVCMRELA